MRFKINERLDKDVRVMAWDREVIDRVEER